MESNDFETLFHNAASPRDYSDSLYLVYLELYETNDAIKEMVIRYATIQQTLAHGYLCQMSIQQVPDLIRSLARENIAVYQLVRLSKIN